MSLSDLPDSACLTAHGDAAPDGTTDADADRPLVVAVFATGVAAALTHFASHLGWRTAVVDPAGVPDALAATVAGTAATLAALGLDLDDADVVVTDHHRDELGPVLREALDTRTRWVGVMGNPRHEGPHVEALRGLGVADDAIARVHRPIGLDIGSRTPPEIALSTLAGLVAHRKGRAGGFHAPA